VEPVTPTHCVDASGAEVVEDVIEILNASWPIKEGISAYKGKDFE
jgi:hypothetical protein